MCDITIYEVKGVEFPKGEKSNYFGFVKWNVVYLVSYPGARHKYIKAPYDLFRIVKTDSLSGFIILEPKQEVEYETLSMDCEAMKELEIVLQDVFNYDMSWWD